MSHDENQGANLQDQADEFDNQRAELIVKSAVKDAINDHNVSSDFYDALDEEVRVLIEDAAKRAEENERKTVQPRDL